MPRISFPHMGYSTVAFRDLLSALGHEVIGPPRPTERTLTLGTKYSPEFACVPFKIVLGTYIECLEMGAELLVTSGGYGPCRAGHYAQLHKEILKDLGYDFRMITLELPRGRWASFFEDLRTLNAAGLHLPQLVYQVRRLWVKLSALDRLERLTHHVRPREATRGATSQCFRRIISKMEHARKIREIRQVEAWGVRQLRALVNQQAPPPLRVGMVGEIYVVLEPFANLELEEALGELGVEVERSIFITEWIKDNVFSDTLGWVGGKKVKKAASPWLPEMVGGHGQDSVGHAVLYARQGFDGMIHLSPFTCIPEIVAKSILPKVSREMNIPVLSISCDELTGKAGLVTRLEAFVDLMQRRRAKQRTAS